ncbi:MAG: 4Fe-4S binding protein [Chloroflexi bacterium]|nr:4Fe-4S binding protein [Chloroflexota bacterium]
MTQLSTIGPVYGPGESVTRKTGSWRIRRPVVNLELCVKREGQACPVCWVVCPDMSILEVHRGVEVNYDYCKGCGLCAYECPAHAIEMIQEGS